MLLRLLCEGPTCLRTAMMASRQRADRPRMTSGLCRVQAEAQIHGRPYFRALRARPVGVGDIARNET
jgi:hypothetical protein